MPPDRLDSWKEIASYLNKTIRTVQRWEVERHLPIHRIPKADSSSRNRGSVYAIPAEIDRWWEAERNNINADGNGIGTPIESNDGGCGGETDDSPPVPNDRVGRPHSWFQTTPGRIAVLGVVLGLLGIGFLVSRILQRPSMPVLAVVEDKFRLLALGDKGNILWVKQFSTSIGCNRLLEKPAKVVDIDADSVNEVITGLYSSPFVYQSDKIVCLNSRGFVRWEFVPGASITWHDYAFPNMFRLWGYSIGSLANGKKFIVAVANHDMDSPSQVAVLDAQGKAMGGYWHTGWIFSHLVMDLDYDGNDEIIVGGVDDLRKKPFLAVIRPEIPWSISPVPAGYAPGFATGEEISYFLFPQTDAAEALDRTSRVVELKKLGDHYLSAGIELPGVPDILERVYLLDTKFQTVRLVLTEEFGSLHKQLKREKRLDHEMREQDKENLRQLERILPAARSK